MIANKNLFTVKSWVENIFAPLIQLVIINSSNYIKGANISYQVIMWQHRQLWLNQSIGLWLVWCIQRFTCVVFVFAPQPQRAICRTSAWSWTMKKSLHVWRRSLWCGRNSWVHLAEQKSNLNQRPYMLQLHKVLDWLLR